jgi:hypothetical protein
VWLTPSILAGLTAPLARSGEDGWVGWLTFGLVLGVWLIGVLSAQMKSKAKAAAAAAKSAYVPPLAPAVPGVNMRAGRPPKMARPVIVPPFRPPPQSQAASAALVRAASPPAVPPPGRRKAKKSKGPRQGQPPIAGETSSVARVIGGGHSGGSVDATAVRRLLRSDAGRRLAALPDLFDRPPSNRE